MGYNKVTIEQAKALYCAGVTAKKIAQELEIHRDRTIFNWAKKFKWKIHQVKSKDKTKTHIDEIIAQKNAQMVEEWIERQGNLARLWQKKALEAIELRDPRNIKVMEAVALGREGCDIERKALGIGDEKAVNIFDSNVIVAWKGQGKQLANEQP